MPYLKNRLDRLDALIPKPPEPPPEVGQNWRRVKKVRGLHTRLLEAAGPHLAEQEQQEFIKAWDDWLERRTGKLAPWLRSLEQGTSRMPKLSPNAMEALCRAWLSPEMGSYVHVCRQCGLATPDHKTPPTSEWKLLPGRKAGEGAPPWDDLPQFFDMCPHCGTHHLDSDYASSATDKDLPWKKLDGYAGPKPEWRSWHKQAKPSRRVGR